MAKMDVDRLMRDLTIEQLTEIQSTLRYGRQSTRKPIRSTKIHLQSLNNLKLLSALTTFQNYVGKTGLADLAECVLGSGSPLLLQLATFSCVT